MASGPITSWQTDGETMETVTDFMSLGSKITADGDCSHEIKRHLFLGRKAMKNLDSILKSRDITLLTKVHLVKAMVFPVVMYGCEVKWSEVAQSCLTLCNPMDYSLSGSSVHGILQARMLEWVAISYSMGLSQSRDQTHILNCIDIFYSRGSQGIFPIQGSNSSLLSLLHWHVDSWLLCHLGSPNCIWDTA